MGSPLRMAYQHEPRGPVAALPFRRAARPEMQRFRSWGTGVGDAPSAGPTATRHPAMKCLSPVAPRCRAVGVRLGAGPGRTHLTPNFQIQIVSYRPAIGPRGYVPLAAEGGHAEEGWPDLAGWRRLAHFPSAGGLAISRPCSIAHASTSTRAQIRPTDRSAVGSGKSGFADSSLANPCLLIPSKAAASLIASRWCGTSRRYIRG